MMVQKYIIWVLLLSSLSLTSCASSPPAGLVRSATPAGNDTEIILSKLTAAMKDLDVDRYRQLFSPRVIEAYPKEVVMSHLVNLQSDYGEPLKIKRSAVREGAYVIQFERGLLDVSLSQDEEGLLTGLLFQPQRKVIPVPKRNDIKFRMPLEGPVSIAWGGDSADLNRHHDSPIQQFALDIDGVDKNNKTGVDKNSKTGVDKNSKTGIGKNTKTKKRAHAKTNQDYYCFGRNVVAPADGVVTEAIDGIRDNNLGEMNPYMALGNAIFIKHGDHEISVLAHLKQGSVQVRRGQKITQGQIIARCGNSGNSSEPHLHFHLQNTDVFQNGTGIKIFFDHLTKLSKKGVQNLTNYSPIRGDVFGEN